MRSLNNFIVDDFNSLTGIKNAEVYVYILSPMVQTWESNSHWETVLCERYSILIWSEIDGHRDIVTSPCWRSVINKISIFVFLSILSIVWNWVGKLSNILCSENVRKLTFPAANHKWISRDKLNCHLSDCARPNRVGWDDAAPIIPIDLPVISLSWPWNITHEEVVDWEEFWLFRKELLTNASPDNCQKKENFCHWAVIINKYYESYR